MKQDVERPDGRGDAALLAELERAAELVYRHISPTPQYRWPLISARAGTDVWIKHENHTPIGSFKIRGGLVYLQSLLEEDPNLKGVITPTRGNHGQSVGFAARQFGVPAVVVVPKGNSREKNAAMRSLGVDLVEHGDDFQDAFEYAERRAADEGLHFWKTWHPTVVTGVASYGLEFLRAVPDLDVVYVPIGQGSGISAMVRAKAALGRDIEIVGVVSERFPAYLKSFEAGAPVSTDMAETIADGVACRTPDPGAVEVILEGVQRIVTVPEAEIKAAMRHIFTDTHNVAEGAGALPLAALLAERERMAGRTCGLVLSGSNVDADVLAGLLAEAA